MPATGESGGLRRLLLRTGIVLLRRRRLAVALSAAGLVAGAAVPLLAPPEHRARSAYVPRMEAYGRPVSTLEFLPPSGFQSLEVATPEASEGPDFYRWLVRSEDILRAVAEGRYGPEEGGAAPLHELLGVDGETPAVRTRKVVEALRGRIAAERTDETGVVRVTTTAAEPWLAGALNRRILDEVEAFIVEKRRERARRELELVDSILASSRAELAEVTRRYERFLARNRRYDYDPELGLEEARLREARERIEHRVESLRVEAEERRAEITRRTPMIAVVQEPTLEPARPGRRAALNGLLGLALGAVLFLLIAVIPPRIRDTLAAAAPPAPRPSRSAPPPSRR